MPINQNGAVVRGTLANLELGVRSSPMSREAIAPVLDQAVAFTARVVETYGRQVAAGEVGVGGSGRASEGPILANRPPRALLYGRIQSGKTVAMILTSALALDNGFKIVVVLTTDNTVLVEQTAARFKDLSGPQVFSSARDGTGFEWEGQEDQLRDFMDAEGMVLVCSKNAYNLPHVIRFLQQIDARTYPVLILDDEADAATPDTTLAARSAGRPNAPLMPSAINRLVVENPDPANLGLSLGEVLTHSFYVQVTATPNVLVMQSSDAQMRPTMTHLLQPGQGYCGGEEFFGDFDMRPGQPQPNTIVLIDDTAALMRRDVPDGLARSLDFFILSACARGREAGWPRGGFKHLSHTSHRIGEHELVAGHIAAHIIRVRRRLRRSTVEVESYFATAYAELSRSMSPPPLADLVPLLASAMSQADVIRVNATTDRPSYGPRLNFVVGGNILGRGLTINDLLVTYYLREAKVPQMDTVWQHARMYGYRRPYLHYMRVYLPHRLGIIFAQLQISEEELRDGLGDDGAEGPVLVRVPRPTRPTRPNALDAGAVRVIPAGRDQINPHYVKSDPAAAADVLATLRGLGVPVDGSDSRADRATPVPFTAALDLVDMVAIVDEEPGLWQPDVVAALMRSFEEDYAGECKVYVRQLRQTERSAYRTRPRLAGPEVALIRAAGDGVPVLVLMYIGSSDTPEGWYPTLVMPPGLSAYQFNRA